MRWAKVSRISHKRSEKERSENEHAFVLVSAGLCVATEQTRKPLQLGCCHRGASTKLARGAVAFLELFSFHNLFCEIKKKRRKNKKLPRVSTTRTNHRQSEMTHFVLVIFFN